MSIWKRLVGGRAACTALLLVVVFAGQGLLSLLGESVTIDEFAHLPTGYYLLESGDFRMYNVNPPLIRMLCALPLLAMSPRLDVEYFRQNDVDHWALGDGFLKNNRADYVGMFIRGRLINLAIAVILGAFVFRWARELHGAAGGLVALALFAFSPNVLAHARLVTPDVGGACAMFAALYAFWTYLRRGGVWMALLAGLALGAAQLAKFTALLLFPLFILFAAAP